MVEFKEGRYFLGLWFSAWETKDMLLSVFTDEDPTKPCIWKMEYRWRYYDEEDPGNDAWSGKDRKTFFAATTGEPKTEAWVENNMRELMKITKENLGAKSVSFVPLYTSDPAVAIELLSKQPWAHVRKLSKEEYEKEYGKIEEKGAEANGNV